ncbi:CYTH and CHAD domain-containing protein [Kitasatospora sp. NPDC004240]
MGTEHVETERKYDGDALPKRLDRVRGVAAAPRAEPQDLDAVYYDTQDLRLLRRRITLRRRTGGGDAGWHLKLPQAEDVRGEVRLPLAAGGPHDVPDELAVRVAAFTRGAALTPVAHLRTHRARRLLRDERGETLAQITEDRVAAQVLDAGRLDGARPAKRGGPVKRDRPVDGSGTEIRGWTEFEVELEQGTPALLDRVEAVFTEAGLVRSSWPSKLSRALGEDRVPETGPDRSGGPASKARAPAAGTAGALVMDGFRDRLATLLDLDGAVRRGEEDSVHRMRVTARRLRSLLKAHRRIFDRERAEALAAELRRLGKLLGKARDQEVLGEELVGQLDAVPARMRRSLRGHLTARYAQGYRQAWQQALARLDDARYFALLDSLDAFAADPPLRRRAGRTARPYLAGVLRREQRRTVKRLDHALRTEPGPRRDEALHSARKAAKRARYTADQARSQIPRRSRKRAAKFGTRMKKLHKVLGDHQDSVVIRRELLTLGGEDTGSRRHAFAYGLLHERQRHLADDAQQRVPKLRRRAGRRKLTRLP